VEVMEINKIDNLQDAINFYNKIVNCEEKIILDFSKATFIRNNFISIIAMALEIQKDKDIEIIEPENKRIQNALKNIGFLSLYSKCNNGIDLNNTMIQCTNIQEEDIKYYEFLEYFIAQLNGKIKNLSKELSNKIMQKIGEQCSNVFRHSESKLGFFCSGQFFQKKEEFYFTIVDNGVTIKSNVNKYLKRLTKENKGLFNFHNYKELNSLESIKWALIDNNSTTGSGGFGLSLLKELILKSKGRLEIISNNGYYKIEDSKESGEILKNKFNGTIISVGLSTDNSIYYYLKEGDNNDN
jgi:hypothetical protein